MKRGRGVAEEVMKRGSQIACDGVVVMNLPEEDREFLSFAYLQAHKVHDSIISLSGTVFCECLCEASEKSDNQHECQIFYF